MSPRCESSWCIRDQTFSVADVYRGWEKALKRQGHVVKDFNTNDRLCFHGNIALPVPGSEKCGQCGQLPFKNALDDQGILQLTMTGLYEDLFIFKPDVVFFVSGFYTTAPLLKSIRAAGIKVVFLHTESPYEDDVQMQRGQFASLNIINDPLRIEDWRGLGIPVQYIPHAYDPEIHYPGSRPPFTDGHEPYECDFSFIGTAFRSRQDFFAAMDATGVFSEVDAMLGGSGWETLEVKNSGLVRLLGNDLGTCVDNDVTASIYRGSKVGINLYRKEGTDRNDHVGYAMGPREVEMAACGLFFLRDPRPESDEIFNRILPVFRSPEEAADHLRFWVARDTLRETQAFRAQVAIAGRTFRNHADKVMKIVEKL